MTAGWLSVLSKILAQESQSLVKGDGIAAARQLWPNGEGDLSEVF